MKKLIRLERLFYVTLVFCLRPLRASPPPISDLLQVRITTTQVRHFYGHQISGNASIIMESFSSHDDEQYKMVWIIIFYFIINSEFAFTRIVHPISVTKKPNIRIRDFFNVRLVELVHLITIRSRYTHA